MPKFFKQQLEIAIVKESCRWGWLTKKIKLRNNGT